MNSETAINIKTTISIWNILEWFNFHNVSQFANSVAYCLNRQFRQQTASWLGRVATVIVAASQEQTITTQVHREITKTVMTSGSLICVCVHAPVQSPIAKERYSFRFLCRWFRLHSSHTPVSPSHQGETPSRLQRRWQFRAIPILHSSKKKSCSQNLSELRVIIIFSYIQLDGNFSVFNLAPFPHVFVFMPQPAMWSLWPLLHYR